MPPAKLSAKQVVSALERGRVPEGAIVYDRQDDAVRHPIQRVKFNAAKVDVDDVTAYMAAAGFENPYEFINATVRSQRRNRYYKKVENVPGAIRMLSEGDSWHMYPVVNDDIVWHLSFAPKIAVYSTDGAGDTLQWIWQQRNDNHRGFLKALSKVKPTHFLLDGGGNDILGARKMADGTQIGGLYFHLNAYAAGKTAEQLIKPSLNQELDALASLTRQIVLAALNFPSVKKVILHGYAYPFPKNDIWLGKPMARKGITNAALQRQICIVLMDRWHERLKALAQSLAAGSRVAYVDVRAAVPNKADWYDEIHAGSKGFKQVAELIKKVI